MYYVIVLYCIKLSICKAPLVGLTFQRRCYKVQGPMRKIGFERLLNTVTNSILQDM